MVYKFVIIDNRNYVATTFIDTPIAGMRQTLLLFADYAKIEIGVILRELSKELLSIVRRIIIDHNALPLASRQILLHKRLESTEKLSGSVIGCDDYRNSRHNRIIHSAKVKKISLFIGNSAVF